MSLRSFWCPIIFKHISHLALVFLVFLLFNFLFVNFEQVKLQLVSKSHRSKNPSYSSFLVRKKTQKIVKKRTVRELIILNFGQFPGNFFREKPKIDQFAKINSREVSTVSSFPKIDSVLKFAKLCNFLTILNHQILYGKNSSTQRVQRINQAQIFFFHAIL